MKKSSKFDKDLNIYKNKKFYEKILCVTVIWWKKPKMIHFGLVLVQTRAVPTHNIFLSKIWQIYLKICGEREFKKKIKKIETLILDREDFTENDT